MITKAHYDSKKFILDPTHSIHGKNPEEQLVPDAPFWRYGHYECEAFLLEKMVRRKDEAKLKVGYTKFRRKPSKTAFFTLDSDVEGTIEFRAAGKIEVLFNGRTVLSADSSDAVHTLKLDQPGSLVIRLETEDPEQDIPALLPLNVTDGWLYSADRKNWSEPVCKPQRCDGLPPHRAELPQVPLAVQSVSSDMWDAGTELLCYVDIECSNPDGTAPELYVGESIPEAENENPEDEEQTRELVRTGKQIWTGKVPLALRYIRLKNAINPRISLRALFHPVEYRGAFSTPGMDDMTKIWMHSAYTLHLCMHNFLLDGIKRDRLPWAGDLAVSLLGNAYSFGDAAIVRDSLSVLGAVSIRSAHINTIVDYTLWWIINHEFYQLYFGDPDFLALEYPRITENVDILLELTDENGFLTARPDDWVFIDWVPGEKFTALQILYVRALRAAAGLAGRMDDSERAAALRERAAKLAETIRRAAWSPERGLFRAAPGRDEFTRHPNLLAVAAGIASPEEAETIAEALAGGELPLVGTPYMSVFEAMAMAKAGRLDDALTRIGEIWGGMLSVGATTFYEGFNPKESGRQHLVFYDRPFGKSLCHAWGAGPLFLLPQILAGIEPVEDGWKTFRIRPQKHLTCAAAVPTPRGIIEIEIEDGEVVVCNAPEGCARVG